VDLPIEHGDFRSFFVCLPEGMFFFRQTYRASDGFFMKHMELRLNIPRVIRRPIDSHPNKPIHSVLERRGPQNSDHSNYIPSSQ